MAWLVSIGITEVRALDAARETARAAARSEGAGEATVARSPGGPRRLPDQPCAGRVAPSWRRVSSPVNGPAGLFGRWASFHVTAEAVAAEEPTW